MMHMPQYHSSTCYQIYVLCRRALSKDIADPSVKIITFVRFCFIACVYGSMYFQLQSGTAQAVYSNRLSIMFLCAMIVTVNHEQSIPSIIAERPLFYREKNANLYGVVAYWVSRVFWEVPFTAVSITAFASIVYFMAGLNPQDHYEHFGYFVLQLVVISWTGLFFSLTVSAISSSAQVGIAMFPVWFLITM
jgi:hypothetical protein